MAGYSAFGVQFQRGDGATPTEVFVTVGEATNISGPGMERDVIDVTSHDSPNRFREYVGGLVDGGEVTFEVNWDPALHVGLIADFQDPTPRNYQIVMPDPPGGDWAFTGFITGMGHEYPHDDKMSADFTFKISGEPVFTEGS
jgi:predicted secreted protein